VIPFVTFRPLARRDVLDQMLYFEEQANEETALRYYDAVLVTCSLLAQKPLVGMAFETEVRGLQQLRRFPNGRSVRKLPYLLSAGP